MPTALVIPVSTCALKGVEACSYLSDPSSSCTRCDSVQPLLLARPRTAWCVRFLSCQLVAERSTTTSTTYRKHQQYASMYSRAALYYGSKKYKNQRLIILINDDGTVLVARWWLLRLSPSDVGGAVGRTGRRKTNASSALPTRRLQNHFSSSRVKYGWC